MTSIAFQFLVDRIHNHTVGNDKVYAVFSKEEIEKALQTTWVYYHQHHTRTSTGGLTKRDKERAKAQAKRQKRSSSIGSSDSLPITSAAADNAIGWKFLLPDYGNGHMAYVAKHVVQVERLQVTQISQTSTFRDFQCRLIKPT